MVVSPEKENLLFLWKKSSNKDVLWVGSNLFFQLQKREINDKGGGICVRCDVTWRKSCDHSWWSVMVRVSASKKAILAWRNYWKTPNMTKINEWDSWYEPKSNWPERVLIRLWSRKCFIKCLGNPHIYQARKK